MSGIGQRSFHCIADCKIRQHGHFLYEQYCCILSKRGKRVYLNENVQTRCIFCPSTRLSSYFT